MAQEFITEIMDYYISEYPGSENVGRIVKEGGGAVDAVIASLTNTSIWVHVTAVFFFAVVGLTGNGITIYLYRTRDELKGGQFYPTVLAIVEVTALCTILPMYPFLGYLQNWGYLFFVCYESFAVAYVWIILAMTIERFMAVFKPFTIQTTSRRLRRVVLALAGFNTVLRFIEDVSVIVDALNGLVISLLFIVTLLAILATYPAIVWKLYRSSDSV